MARPNRPTLSRIAAMLALLAVAWLARELGWTGGVGAADSNAARPEEGVAQVARAFAARESGLMVTLSGRVERVLADDRDGSRHQRFLLDLAGGPTLLVAHNIDLAERAPVDVGDPVRLRGQYEWNERGGVLHWTHRDPEGDHPGGWIEVDGVRVE